MRRGEGKRATSLRLRLPSFVIIANSKSSTPGPAAESLCLPWNPLSPYALSVSLMPESLSRVFLVFRFYNRRGTRNLQIFI